MERIRRIRNVFQISLRTVFILTTAVAMTMATIDWSVADLSRSLSAFGLVLTRGDFQDDEALWIYWGWICFLFALSSSVITLTSLALEGITSRFRHERLPGNSVRSSRTTLDRREQTHDLLRPPRHEVRGGPDNPDG